MLKKFIPLVAVLGLMGSLAGCAEQGREGGGGGTIEEEGVFQEEGMTEENENVGEPIGPGGE